jgi:hypothetical protein
MLPTATHDEDYNAPARALFVTFELREKSSNPDLTSRPWWQPAVMCQRFSSAARCAVIPHARFPASCGSLTLAV